MKSPKYVALTEVDAASLLEVLNAPENRGHLIDHPRFDSVTLQDWVDSKVQMDSQPGCRVRAIVINGKPVGWCGIQVESGQYELAMVIDSCFWGLGPRVFRDLMNWAHELGHESILVHFLETRREYRFLQKMAKQVFNSTIFGRRFKSYQVLVKPEVIPN